MTVIDFERQERLTGRQIYLIAASATAQLVDFLDFFLIGFVITFISKPWRLDVAEGTVILLASGFGAVLGSFACGNLSDRFGRRPVFLATLALFAAATGGLVMIPQGAWRTMAFLRFFVGFSTTGMYAVNIPLLQEFMPSRLRGVTSGVVVAFIPAGILLGSALVALFGHAIGWRGLLAIGALPAVPLIVGFAFVPESPLWLAARGLRASSLKSVAWALDRPLSTLSGVIDLEPVAETARLREIFRYPRSLIVSWAGVLGAQTAYYGVSLWAPTLLVLTLGVAPARAAYLLIFANLGDLSGRLFFTVAARRLGQATVGVVQGFLGAALLVATALCRHAFLGGVSVLWLLLIATYFVVSGGFAVTLPYTAELWPVRLRATGLGSTYGIGSLGKITGPLGLGLMLGSSHVLSPEASSQAILPAFSYLAVWLVGSGVAFLFAAKPRATAPGGL